MYSNSIALPTYPEWYRIERESEKIIGKLTSIKELSFYLRNSDEYIRRLAILRIAEIKLKDAIELLKEILDDRIESQINKELAAWAIKSISLKWGIDLFIGHKLLNKYSGSERTIDINKVTMPDGDSSVKFEFTTSLISSELELENEDFRHSEDIDFAMPFSVKEWFSEWVKEFSQTARTVFVNLPGLLIKFMARLAVLIVRKILINASRTLWHGILRCYAGFKNRPEKHKSISAVEPGKYGRTTFDEKVTPLEPVKNALYRFIYIVLAPVRLIIKHRRFSIATFLVIYLSLAYTSYGKIVTYKYAGLDLVDMQNRVYASTKELLGYAGNELKGILSTGQPGNTLDTTSSETTSLNITQSGESKTPDKLEYRVTAKTGLNVRKEPSAVSEKVTSKMLTYNSTVTYLGKSQKDSAGKLWYFIRTPDGKNGWVYTKWLEKM